MNTKNADKFVKSLRLKLGYSQSNFAIYLNKNTEITGYHYNQSAISKIENKQTQVPSDVLLHCLNELQDINSNLEYPVNDLINDLNSLDPVIHFKILESMHILARNSTQ